MAIKINQSADRINPPTIAVTGERVIEGMESGNADSEVITTQTVRWTWATTIRTREALSFKGDVTVTLTPDSSLTPFDYSLRSASDFVGKAPMTRRSDGSGRVNQKAETYYTLNGKDPIRTKANLYTGPFTLRSNKSGTDSTIIKVKTYQGGKVSVVRTVEVLIQLKNSKKV